MNLNESTPLAVPAAPPSPPPSPPQDKPQPYPLTTGAGERLKVFLKQLLPEVLKAAAPQTAGNPMAAAALNFVPTLLERQHFTDEQAISLLETFDDLVSKGFQDVLGVDAE